MARYCARRLLVCIPLLVLVTVAVFALALLTPGDPADALHNPELELTAEQIQAMREAMGLTQPAPERYARWLGQLLRGDFGYRLTNGDAIGPLLVTRLERTILLSGLALMLGVGAGLTLGIVSALRRYDPFDHAATALAMVGIATPDFLVGVMGLWLFAVTLGWFPVGGLTTAGADPHDVGDFIVHLILPVVVLGASQVAGFYRYARMSMLEVLQADYLITAHAKGLSAHRVILTHALRNALLPIVTVVGLSLPRVFGGAVFVEALFNWPGMGLLFLDGVHSRDYPLILGLTLILATVVLLANLVTDVAYALVDPRIRYQR